MDYFLAIENENDDKYDMLSYEISKFLFYNFNDFLKINNLPILPIQLFRSTKVLGNDYTLKILQETN